MKIGIIDVGVGNLGSLRNALLSQGWDPSLVSNANDLTHLTHLILPGVGSFASYMHSLHQARLTKPICDFSGSGRPLLGICLGMQILSSRGSEGGNVEGLDLIPGYVAPISAIGVRLPHVGWNNIDQLYSHPVLRGVRNDVDFYFVHGYRFHSDDSSHVLAQTEHGETFPAIVGRANVFGVQFHPEKSQENGLRVLDNFCLWDGLC